jgi:hypothetical protein
MPYKMVKGLSPLIFNAIHVLYKITRINFLLSVAFVLNRAAKEPLLCNILYIHLTLPYVSS